MKKQVASLMVGLMIITGAGAAYATGETAVPAQSRVTDAVDQMDKGMGRLEALREFQDELHIINALRTKHLELKTGIVQKQDRIIDLTLNAADNHEVKKLKDAAEVKKQIAKINEDLQTLDNQVGSEIKEFRQANKDSNKDLAQKHINNVISLLGEIDGKLVEKNNLLGQIVDILK